MVQDQRAAKLCSNELPVTDSTCLEFGEKVCHITIVIMPGNPQLHDHQLCQIQSFFILEVSANLYYHRQKKSHVGQKLP